jgi:hypothetical protein
MNLGDSLIAVAALVFVTAVMIMMMASSHELVHQEIYRNGCLISNTSIHFAGLKAMLTENQFMYTLVEVAKNCSKNVELANMYNEIIGYQFIVPVAIICGFLAAIFISIQIKN